MNEKFVTIKEAAAILGVSKLTLRNWDRGGKLSAYRHPISNYRIYKTDELQKIITQIESGERPLRPNKDRIRKLTVLHLED